MSKIVEFFDKIEDALGGGNNENKKEVSLGFYTERQIWGCFLVGPFDLFLLIDLIFGFDASFCVIFTIVPSLIASEIFIHILKKRIEAQETEELKEDLKDDIEEIFSKISTVIFIATCILLLLFWKKNGCKMS